jgi:phage terminase large subunit-like protein
LIDAVTKSWIRNAADQRASENGCRFDPDRAAHICEFFPKYLRLYEGEKAGQQFKLIPWQVDALSRIFGWVKKSDFAGREVRRFRKACIFVPKKNGKSPLGAGVGLYLLIADGEQGQKVFSAARDGKQAGIVHTHARKMIESSPELKAVCKINQSTGRITHLPTSSYYDLLSGDNIQGQEGLNGSVIIDETHVVDQRLASVIEFMGASRTEPLQFEVSTAGSNPIGYGRRQYEYGREVNAGRFPDDAFFFEAHEAPQDSTDEQLDNLDVWKIANPSWGYTISPEEFSESLKRSKRSLNDWTNFKMYRLNMWANSANPFIRAADWKRCEAQFSLEDLKHLPCVASLDLARRKDLTALSLLFGPDEEDCFWIITKFWMPELRANEMAAEVPYLQWARSGHVTLTEGDICDYRVVESDVSKLFDVVKPSLLMFDPTFAHEMIQRLSERHGFTALEFTQNSLIAWARPTQEFENLIVAGRLRHNGHPIMSWQIGHVLAKEYNGQIRPIRPNRGDHRTVDGVVATIMALAGAMDAEPQYTFTPGSLAL